jgi:hypothetical protein
MTQQCRTAGTPLGAVGRGLVAGAVGTLAMDVVLYARTGAAAATRLPHLGILRRHLQLGRGTGGGRSAGACSKDSSRKLPPDRAALINNITQWAYGLLNGALYGITVESLTHPLCEAVVSSL